MTLTLQIRNFERLDNGMPTELVLHRRGALIGRANVCDWSLPDPRNYISSRHCEISFADGFYYLTDTSTNGTYLNGSTARLAQPRRIEHGDLFQVGAYEIVAGLSGEAAVAMENAAAEAESARQSGWSGWNDAAGGAPAPAPAEQAGFAPPPPAASRWGQQPAAPPAQAPSLGGGEGWVPSARAPDIAVASAWAEPAAPAEPASGWSSAAPDRPAAPSADDVWGRLAEGNVVDWARGGFGEPIKEHSDPLGLGRDPLDAVQGNGADWAAPGVNGGAAPANPPDAGWAAPRGQPASAPRARGGATLQSGPRAASPPAAAPQSPAVSPEAAIAAFNQGTGVDAARLKELSPATLDRAGQLFRRLVAGLVVMVEARARAKSQMGAEATMFEAHGNNPIKFARTPDDAVAALLNPPERGFVEPGRAIDDAFLDLQSHQMATLKAMQGALRATLERFSPAVISKRAEEKGLLERIIPAARNAALWQAYEKEFSGVAQGSDEAFMDVFAKEFRKAYEEQSRKR
jgi:type VI secretion system FHA domain protein